MNTPYKHHARKASPDEAKQVVVIFDEWRSGLPETEQIIIDHHLDKLVDHFDTLHKPFGVNSAKELLAHTLCQVKPNLLVNQKEK
jgi:hypothetical protein